MITLRPCPKCKGIAEMDPFQTHRNVATGDHELAVSIHCTACELTLTYCYADMPDLTPEWVAEQWNTQPAHDLLTDLVIRLAAALRDSNPSLSSQALSHVNVPQGPTC